MQSSVQLNFDRLDGLVDKFKSIAQKSVQLGTPVHEAEKSILENLLQMGDTVLSSMFQSVGCGDVGPTLERPQFTRPLIRYPEPSIRTFRSIYGDFSLPRYLYGKAPSQKALATPFDEHFGLPANRFSLLPESRVSQLSTSEAIHEAMDKLDNILGVRIGVDSAERILARTRTNAEHFQDGSSGVPGRSCQKSLNERIEDCFPSFSRVVNELEEREVERQFLLRDAPMRT